MSPVRSVRRPDRPTRRCSAITRRSFLKAIGALVGAAVLDGCCSPGPAATSPTPGTPEAASATTPPTAVTPGATPATTSPAPATPWPASAPALVAIGQAVSYDPKLVRQQVEAVFDGLGGLEDVVKAGDRVAIKVNLTGGVRGASPSVVANAPETYVTHPAVARAVGELLRDAGAKEIYIVEAVWEGASFEEWGYVEVADDLGAELIDLNDSEPYSDYATTPVGRDWFIYESFTFNHILEEVDAFVSLAKMKCHWLCGITQSMKNLIGLVPYRFYELKAGDGYRTGLHGPEAETKSRLPRVVVDLNRARPIDLSLIDGIKTVDGSEGPWNRNLGPQSPGLLIGGKNALATDAVAVAAMGFDPAAEYPDAPFLRADNHLNIACAMEMGTNRLADIEVVGAKLDDVTSAFQPAW
jgi:uncharacterized protein (DUF362 family)